MDDFSEFSPHHVLLFRKTTNLTSLKAVGLSGNQLTSVPVEVGQLRSLERLDLSGNQLTSVPAEVGQLASIS